jgi:hypothetical protein
MTGDVSSVLMGSVATLSLVATLFFLRFWRKTHDNFFLLFSIAFALDSATRFVLALSHVSVEAEPLFYVSRLLTFSLIILAIVQKNRPINRNG